LERIELSQGREGSAVNVAIENWELLGKPLGSVEQLHPVHMAGAV